MIVTIGLNFIGVTKVRVTSLLSAMSIIRAFMLLFILVYNWRI